MRTYTFNALDKDWHSIDSSLKSFDKFNLNKKFINLAKAGFFLHSSGSIKCCVCNIKLDNWFHIQNPIVEHCIANPSCKFLEKELGIEAVYNVVSNYSKNFQIEDFVCSICLLNPVIRFLLCGHLFCNHCLKSLPDSTCPKCRSNIPEKYEFGGKGYFPEKC